MILKLENFYKLKSNQIASLQADIGGVLREPFTGDL
jgi:hypothetical protein